jgi:nucleotide-binding universal stress UspA family protein
MPGAAGALVARDEAFNETSDDLRSQVEQAAQERGISITFVATRGDPYFELRRIADEIRADAVVVGAPLPRLVTGWLARSRSGWCERAGGR